MQTRLKLLPGQHGTKKLLQQYGDQLICVRYRYDSSHNKRYKTVELIVDEVPWISRNNRKGNNKAPVLNKVVSVRIGYKEIELRNVVKEAGGQWNQDEKVWKLPLRKVMELGLEKRVNN